MGCAHYLPDRSWILRTAWLYGWHGKNFVDTILRLARERDTLEVVADQQGQPTWTVDLAHRIVDTVVADAPDGVYHATSSGHTTWHGLAQTAIRLIGSDATDLRPTTTDAFPLRLRVRRGPCSATSTGPPHGSSRCALGWQLREALERRPAA